jgi:hypothetical protein
MISNRFAMVSSFRIVHWTISNANLVLQIHKRTKTPFVAISEFEPKATRLFFSKTELALTESAVEHEGEVAPLPFNIRPCRHRKIISTAIKKNRSQQIIPGREGTDAFLKCYIDSASGLMESQRIHFRIMTVSIFHVCPSMCLGEDNKHFMALWD